jgi:hypothetical protein
MSAEEEIAEIIYALANWLSPNRAFERLVGTAANSMNGEIIMRNLAAAATFTKLPPFACKLPIYLAFSRKLLGPTGATASIDRVPQY